MAFEGPGGTRVVHVTIHTYGKSYVRREWRGNTLYIFHYVHIDRPPAAPGEGNIGGAHAGAPSGAGGGGGGPSAAEQRESAAREAYRDAQRAARERAAALARRQREALARAMSSAASRPTPGKAPVSGDRPALRPEYIDSPDRYSRDFPMSDEERKAVDAQFAKDRKSERKAAREAAERLSRYAIAAEQRATFRRLGALRNGIRLHGARYARHLEVDDIILLANHGLSVSDPESTRVVQWWLRGNGHKEVEVDGQYGPATDRAMRQEFRQAVRREVQKQTEMVVRTFYRNNLLKAGDPAPAWWPLHGRTPTPNQLRKLLQEGGFASSMIWTLLQRELRNPYTTYLIWRRQHIREQADSLFGPMGPSGYLSRSVARIIGPEPERLLMARVYGQQVANVYANDSADDEATAIALRALAARWQSLNTSTTLAQHTRDLARIEQIEEIEWAREQAKRAQDLPWWADVLETVMRPGEWARTQLIAEIKWLVDDPLSYMQYSTQRAVFGAAYIADELGYDGPLSGFQQRWDDEEAYYRAIAKSEIEDSPWAVRFAYEMVVDPINFIPIGGWAAKGAKITMKGVSLSGRAGRAIGTSDQLYGTTVGNALLDLGGRIDTLGLESMYLPKGLALARQGIRSVPGVEKVVSRAGALKLDVVNRVQNTAQHALRRRFRVADKRYGDLPYADEYLPKGKYDASGLEMGERAMFGQLTKAMDTWIASFVKDGVSLFGKHNRIDYSTVGSMFRGFGYEIARIQSTKRVAHNFAAARREAFVASLEDPATRAQHLAHRKKFAAESDDDAIARLSQFAYDEEYKAVVSRSGSYLKGIANRELDDLIWTQVFLTMDRFENHVMVHLQTMIEEALEKGGREMWDEAGTWVGLGGDLETMLKEMAAKSFDPENMVTRDNPIYGQVLRQNEFEDQLQSEIRRETARYYAWVGRQRAEGNNISEKTITAKLAEIEKEAREGWVRIERATFRVRMNEEVLAQIRAKLNLPDIPIEMKVVKVDKYDDWVAGRYIVDKSGNQKILIQVPESALLKSKGRRTAKKVLEALNKTPAHEYRHAFQWDTDGGKWFFGEGTKSTNAIPGYAGQAREIDARAFADEFMAQVDDAVSYEMVPGGSYVNVNETVQVSKLYARDLSEVWNDLFDGRGDLGILAGAGGDKRMMQDLADVIGALSDPGRDAALVGPLDKVDSRFTPGFAKRDKPTLKFDRAEFYNAVSLDEEAVSRAWDSIVSQMYWSNWAIFAAMTHAESEFQRKTVAAIQGAMDVWMLATLPLRPGWTVRNVIDNYVKSFVAGMRDPRAIFLGAKTPGHNLGKGITSIFGLGVRPMIFAARHWDEAHGTNVAGHLDSLSRTFWDRPGDEIGKVFKAHGVPVADSMFNSTLNKPWELIDPKMAAGRPLDTRAYRAELDRLFAAGDETNPRFGEIATQLRRDAADAEPGWFKRFKDKSWDLMAQQPEMYAKRSLYRDTFYKVQRREIDRGTDAITADQIAMKEAFEKVEEVLFDYSKVTIIEDNLRVIFPFIQFWRKNTRFWIETSIKQPWVPYDLARIELAIQQENEDLPQWMRRYLSLEPVGDLVAKVPGLAWLGDYIAGEGLENFVTDPMNMLSVAPLWRAFKNQNNLLPGDNPGLPFIAPFLDALNDWGLPMNPFVRKALEGAGIANQRAWQTVFPQTALLDAFQREYFDNRFGWIRDWEIVFEGPWADGNTPSEEIADNLDEYVNREMVNQLARGEQVSRERAEDVIAAFFWTQNLLGYVTGVYGRRLTQEDIYIEKLYDGVNDPVNLTSEQRAILALWHKRKMTARQFDAYLDLTPSIQAFYLQTDYAARQAYKKEHPEIIPYIDSAWNNDGKVWSSRYVATQALLQDSEAAFKMWELADGLDLSMETTRLAERIFITPELRAFWAQNDTPADLQQRFIRGFVHRYYTDLSRQYYSIPETDYDAKNGFLDTHPQLLDYWSSFNSPDDDFAALINSFHADMRERYFEYVDDNDWDGANAFLQRFPFIFDRVKDGKLIRDRETGRPDGRFSGRSQSQHAQDYLAAKKWLDYYFSLPEAQRSAWLNGGSAGASVVMEYFKKYSDYNAADRSFRDWEDAPFMTARNADLQSRLKFWNRYFQLDQDKRERFVEKHAEEAGIFIYGALSMGMMMLQEAQYLRRAYAMGMTPKAAHYLYVKPMLDFFFTLGRNERKLFLSLNPELEQYFQKYAGGAATGDPRLDKLLERYFKLPMDSPARSAFLEKHPEVQDYFDENASPRERAMRRLLEKYFDIESPAERKEFLLQHPEIQDYFDRKAAQRDSLQAQLSAFDEADPRLVALMQDAAQVMTASQLRMLAVLLQKKMNDPDEIGVRYEREPAA